MDVPEYHLPEEAIAQHPVEPRDAARLLVSLDGDPIEHRFVRDLPSLVQAGDVVVVNTSRVRPARLLLTKRSGGVAEILLLEPDLDGEAGHDEPPELTWRALARPGRRLPPGTVLYDRRGDPAAEVGDWLSDGQRRVRLLADDIVERMGALALPPYIHERLADPDRYQTVYADAPGSIAAPTAGLHLTRGLLDQIRARGAAVHGVDLSVGVGTFQPVTATRAEEHVMHAERYAVSEQTWAACQRARRVVAVGTTTVRALESAAATGALEGRSDLFIRGDYPFAVVDALLTNFHQSRSTLLLLLEAFIGPRWRELYATAIDEGYRFLSFGDAMFVGSVGRRR